MTPGAAVSLLNLPDQDVLLHPASTSLAVLVPDGSGAGLPVAAIQAARAQPSAVQWFSTGNSRLDTLLGGGYPSGASTLLYGPSFAGKQVLQQLAFVAAACRGIPSAYILHGLSADAMSQRLRALDARFAAAEQAGVVTYIDAYSQFLGEPTSHPNTLALDDVHDPLRLIKALDQRPGFAQGPSLMAVQSASTLFIDRGPAFAFRFLRTVVGHVVKAGGTALVCLQSGMHSDADIEMAKHVCSGMLELRRKGEIHALHAQGLQTTVPRPGWVEYEFTPRSFKLTGGFATRTIR